VFAWVAPKPIGAGTVGSPEGDCDRPPGRTGWGLLGRENEAERDDEADREEEVDDARRIPSEFGDVGGRLLSASSRLY
jgi:hypothetical protein